MSATVKTPSPLGATRPISPNMGQLDNIFQSIKKQIDQWGENAKWKIDLILLDDPKQPESNISHPLLSPQQLHTNAITTPPVNETTTTTYSIPITSTIEYPWDYISPSLNNWCQDSDDLQQKLHKSIEHQHYLENVIWSQAEQIKKTCKANDDNIINTMKTIYLLSQNEQKIRHLVETNLLQKDINTLNKKLRKMANTLYDIENIEIADNEMDTEQLKEDRKILLRKLHLANLRLSARDAEIEHLRDIIDTYKINTTEYHPNYPKLKLRKTPSYLFQQQYSPRNSEVRLSESHHPLSGLDSLGIVADQMLSDPEFENPPMAINEKRLRSRLDDRRSQRSIDSAATLLAMPQLHHHKEEEVAEDHVIKKPRSTYTRWTEAEDAMLRSAVKKYGHSNWEACSKMVHGRSNIQCRNRWIRHLEHKPVIENKDARQSPSIAALLNTNDDYYEHTRPPYRPPSPMTTPKGKLRSTAEITDRW